jgi:hypothetical protein
MICVCLFDQDLDRLRFQMVEFRESTTISQGVEDKKEEA